MAWPKLSKCYCNQQHLINSLLLYMANLESSQELGRLCSFIITLSNILHCQLDIDLFRYGFRLPWSCAAPARWVHRDAYIQHCKRDRVWSMLESQYTCSLQWAMLAVYSAVSSLQQCMHAMHWAQYPATRFWSVHNSSQYPCSLQWAMLTVYSSCKQFASMRSVQHRIHSVDQAQYSEVKSWNTAWHTMIGITSVCESRQ